MIHRHNKLIQTLDQDLDESLTKLLKPIIEGKAAAIVPNLPLLDFLLAFIHSDDENAN